MTTIDLRTRNESDLATVQPAALFEGPIATALDANGELAGRAARRLELPPLTLDVEGEPITFAPADTGVTVTHAAMATLEIGLDAEAFSDLIEDNASTFGLQMTGRAQVVRGNVDDFVAWEPVLRTVLDGRPAYEPGSISFVGRDGEPLDLHRSFRSDADPDEIGHFLAQAGYLHLEGVFTEAEMAAVSADLDAAVRAADRDDGASWWARTEAGEWYAARILGFNQSSPALRDLLRDGRFARIGTFTDDAYVQRDPDVGDSAEGLLKKVGVVEGISDVSWHKDCAMGGHSRHCCGLTVGLSITGAGRDNGELGAVAGSHRANVAPLGIEGLDLPRIPLPTRTGDVTVHCSCTLHMSRPPTSAERRVVYTGFSLAPRPGDHRAARSEDETRRARAALNDHVRDQRRASVRMATFDL